jgi:hypothetical protein
MFLRVNQDQQGYWSAYRDDYPLLHDGKPARFATHTEAQRTATRTSSTYIRMPKQSTTVSHGSPIQASTGARSCTSLSSTLTRSGVRPVSCLDLAVTRWLLERPDFC